MIYKIKAMSKKYGKKYVLKNINLEIEKNEKVVIIGPSGSGKSTFLRCLNTLEDVSSGAVYFNDLKLNKHSYKKIQGKIGMVFQSFQLFDNMTVLENITLAPVLNKVMSKEEAKSVARIYLKQIHLKGKEDFYPRDLSGGEKQRVAIIRTLMMNPDVILFDEPTSALDPEMTNEVLMLITEVSKKNITMIIVTHEIDFAKNIATRVLFMDRGRIVEDDCPEKIFNHPKSIRLQQFLNSRN